MKTIEFFEKLQPHADKALLFEYSPNKLVGANYHITEVKHVKIDSVDCGAGQDAWNETVVQLWESPSEAGKTEYMPVYKALAILNKVGRMRPYDMNAEIKFEYSNASFHTAQLYISELSVKGNQLVVSLSIQKTDCKAKELCGIPEPTLETSTSNYCSPESGCC
tara:strand:- start:321454 stop:321945 length:492 start_codon:yes stop_codon:yes gene_type:complete